MSRDPAAADRQVLKYERDAVRTRTDFVKGRRSMGTGRVLSTGTRLRVAVAVIILLINTVHGSSFTVLPWALLVIGADLVTGAVLASAPYAPATAGCSE